MFFFFFFFPFKGATLIVPSLIFLNIGHLPQKKCKGASIWPTFIVYIYESLVLGKRKGTKVSLGHLGGIHWELNENILGTHWEQEKLK
jgi:hypothetical protein